MRRLKLMQVVGLLPASKTSPAETRSNNSGRLLWPYFISYTLLCTTCAHRCSVHVPTGALWNMCTQVLCTICAHRCSVQHVPHFSVQHVTSGALYNMGPHVLYTIILCGVYMYKLYKYNVYMSLYNTHVHLWDISMQTSISSGNKAIQMPRIT